MWSFGKPWQPPTKPHRGHWHVIVNEGDNEPRIVKVLSREHAELEARLEGQCSEWIAFRDVKIEPCGDDCIG